MVPLVLAEAEAGGNTYYEWHPFTEKTFENEMTKGVEHTPWNYGGFTEERYKELFDDRAELLLDALRSTFPDCKVELDCDRWCIDPASHYLKIDWS